MSSLDEDAGGGTNPKVLWFVLRMQPSPFYRLCFSMNSNAAGDVTDIAKLGDSHALHLSVSALTSSSGLEARYAFNST